MKSSYLLSPFPYSQTAVCGQGFDFEPEPVTPQRWPCSRAWGQWWSQAQHPWDRAQKWQCALFWPLLTVLPGFLPLTLAFCPFWKGGAGTGLGSLWVVLFSLKSLWNSLWPFT
jgi:hypothetical protein